MPGTCTTEEKVPYAVAYVTAAGSPAVVDGAPVPTTDNSAIATGAADPDGMTGFFVSGDTAGTVNISVTADADLSPGTNAIVLSDVLTVTAPGAAGGTMTLGTPVPK